MSQDSLVLGLNTAHDAAACLLRDGEIVVAINEERLSRRKHHEGYPYESVEYCLREAGLSGLNDISCIVMNEYEQTDYETELLNGGYPGELVVNPSHHLLHAYYAWAASGFDDTAILVVDGSGYSYGEYVRRKSPHLGRCRPEFSAMEEAESLYVVRDGNIEVLDKRWALWEASSPYYRFGSLGHMFSMASQYIFGHMSHAGKTMGLAPFGDPSILAEPVVDLSGEQLRLDTSWVTRLPPRSDLPADRDPVCRNLAAKVQAELERAMLHLVDRLHKLTGLDRLSMSGGVTLNSVVNGRIVRESPMRNLFVTPAASDAGVAIGAALYGHHRRTGKLPQWTYTDDYHGRSSSRNQVVSACEARRSQLRWEMVPDAPERAADEIAAGKVVGWFEGGSEFGPRSLGHRTILCDPRDPRMRDHLNEFVKYREPFRPYAASVLAERANEFFEMPVDDPFMLIVAPVRDAYRDVIASVSHVDNTCRLQTVSRLHKGGLRRLIERFDQTTGVPLVLNTSFNIRGEPIVETPDEALDCFLGCNLDVLYIEGYRVTKFRVAAVDDPETLAPHLSSGLTMGSSARAEAGRALDPEHYVQIRTGRRISVTRRQLDLLMATDGRRTIADLAAVLGRNTAETVREMAFLQLHGLASMGRTEHSATVASGDLATGPA